ncbi:MAG: Lrp/AsnC family transcriptional regulator [Haloferacaceae archaeon]
MVHAYVAIITGTGSSPDVVEEVRATAGVTEAHVVAGAYDVIAEIEVDDVASILEVVSSTLQHIEGVGTTRTYVTLD